MKVGERAFGSVKIYTVRLGEGCPEACAQCGAYPAKSLDAADLIPMGVTRERIEECLNMRFALDKPVEPELLRGLGVEREIVDQREIVRLRLADLLANYVTTDINQEPLRGDAFLHFAQLVKQLTNGRSRAVCISHGLRVVRFEDDGAEFDPVESKRLDDIVQFMDEKDIFVLSMDLSRSGGKISEKVNFASYLETLQRLRPAIERGARITVSIQGNDDEASHLYRGETMDFYHTLRMSLQSLGWQRDELDRLHLDMGRSWVNIGRARDLPGIDPSGESPVIPDISFVAHTLDNSVYMAYLDAISGGLWMHANNRFRTYNDVSRLSRWLAVRGLIPVSKLVSWKKLDINGHSVVDLTESFSRRARVLANTQGRRSTGGMSEDGHEKTEGLGFRRSRRRPLGPVPASLTFP